MANWITYPQDRDLAVPEDLEADDREDIFRYIESYMSGKYPEPSLEIFSTFDKQYWLPALKVLDKTPECLVSPGYTAKWINGELRAECMAVRNIATLIYGNGLFETKYDKRPKHDAPEETCNCGIYGSVNLEEIALYYSDFLPRNSNFPLPIASKTLCIIEPFPDAKTIICRKGWKTSHAFISEIIGETMSLREASNLLSMVWNRKIDIERMLHENW